MELKKNVQVVQRKAGKRKERNKRQKDHIENRN